MTPRCNSLLAHLRSIGQRVEWTDFSSGSRCGHCTLDSGTPNLPPRALVRYDSGRFNRSTARILSDMPKQRQTCTRCSQRRQKCDRSKTGKAPCSRCVQNNEGHLCSTVWAGGYDPAVHRKYPRKSSPAQSWPASSETASSGATPPTFPAVEQLKLPALTPGTSNCLSSSRASLMARTPGCWMLPELAYPLLLVN